MEKKKYFTLLALLICTSIGASAQTKVKIEDLYYNLSGESASVAQNSYSSGNSLYTANSYIIPETVTYNGLSFTVNKLDDYAFSTSSSYYIGSTAEKIFLPNTITRIGRCAFRNCKQLVSLVIPKSVSSFGDDNVFYGCDFLREIIYLPLEAPKYWTATTNTYVPDIQSYSSPKYSINGAKVIEMITFDQTEFDYTGQSPTTTWTNNVKDYSVDLTMPILEKSVGNHVAYIPATFTKGEESFSTEVVYRYTIKPVTLTAKVNDISRAYGEENPTFTISYTGFMPGDNETSISTAPTTTTSATATSNVGTYPISISGGVAENYTLKYESGSLTVTKAELGITVKDTTKIYGSANPSFTLNYSGLKNNESQPKWEKTPTFITTATNKSDVGKYQVDVECSATNYNIVSTNPGMLSITQAPLVIKAKNASRMYFEEDPEFDYTCSGFTNNDDINVLTQSPKFTTDATKTANAGKYKITPSGAEANNYNITYEDGELSITKRPVRVSSHCSIEYGEGASALPLEYAGLVNNDTEEVFETKPSASTSVTKYSPVGDYPISIKGGVAVNYDFTYEQGVLSVIKAPLSAKVSDATKIYGATNPTFTIEYFGLKNDETTPAWKTRPTFQTEATQKSDAGKYTISAVKGEPTNYELGEITAGTLTITPAPLTIKANDATRQYYNENPTFSYRCSGFVNGDNEKSLTTPPSLTSSASLKSSVGTYEIKVENASSPNYDISYANGTLTITPRTLIASVGNYEKTYNEENPKFEVKYEGLGDNDETNAIISEPIITTKATKTSDVGTYSIDLSGGEAENYQFTYVSGKLTINKAEQTITWEQDLSNLKKGDQILLNASASSELPITYTIEETDAAEIYTTGEKVYLDCIKGGSFSIVANQPGNENYYSSPRIRINASINDGNNNEDDDTIIGDVNKDKKVDISDIVAIINIIAGVGK